MNRIPNVNIAVQDCKSFPGGAAFPWSKACEARPVDDEASKIWRRGQNIQGECRRIFWAPQEYRCLRNRRLRGNRVTRRAENKTRRFNAFFALLSDSAKLLLPLFSKIAKVARYMLGCI